MYRKNNNRNNENVIKSGEFSLTRREILSATASIATVGMPNILRAQGQTFTVRDPGGAYTKAFTETLYRPFTKETGIEIIPVTSSGNPTTQIKAMVDTSNYAWDLVTIGGMAHEILREGNYLEKLDLGDDPNIRSIPAELRGDYIIGEEVYSTVLAYRTDVYGKAPPKNGWADFWDVGRFPGRRSLWRQPFDTLEIALLGDGVPRDKVYPIDIQRAFASLGKIKPNINVWYGSGAECIQLLISKEIDMCSSWTAGARAVIESGAPVEISWNQGLAQISGWCVLRGSPKADLARRFIRFASRPDRQAAYTNILKGGPTNPETMALLDQKTVRILPTFPENYAQQIPVNYLELSKVRDAISEKFLTWIVQ